MEDIKYTEEYVLIGGIEQYMLHYQGMSETSVVLYLHGGPGQSHSTYAHYFMKHWDNNSNMVFWDQRGAGKTLTRNSQIEAYPTVQRLLEDVKEIVEYIKGRYGVQKVIIMGYSWGSMLGTMFIKRYPEDVAYYIGICQSVEIVESERRNYEKLRNEIIKSGNDKDLEEIEKMLPYPEECLSDAMTEKTVQLRKIQRKYNLINGINETIIQIISKSPVFSVTDMMSILNAPKANAKIVEYLYGESLLEQDSVYHVPVFYILGDHDWELAYTLAEEYFYEVSAPYKKLYIMEGVSHIPMVEDPEKFADILSDIYKEYHDFLQIRISI